MPVLTPMQIHGIPNFCGGRLLTNFFGYEPNEFDAFFKQVIGVLGTVENRGNLGMVAAYTNRSQKNAEPFLEKLGFKRIFTTDKYGNYDRETGKTRSDDSSPCVSWAGDWYHDILPAIKAYQEEIATKRNAAATTSNLRRPAAPVAATTPQPVQRDTTQFRVGDVVRVMFSTRTFTVVSVMGRYYTCRSHATGNMIPYRPNDLILVTRA